MYKEKQLDLDKTDLVPTSRASTISWKPIINFN